MKKLFLLSIIAVLGMTTVNAQGNLNAGVNLGLPIGDAGDGWTFNVTLDVNYLWEVGENFDAGVATGYSHSFGDSIDVPGFGSVDIDDAQFLPIAGAARFGISDKFTLGADLGYALGINDGNDGGFYYAPRVQYGVSESLDIVLSYRGVSLDGGSFDVINLGIQFGL
ncbi:porin family protein [Flaviramulus sp. BrNp1-15]|uniref:outer membrane beta-barrel protein n=1 Tax=Flaviramulus sp. BrNp1-15 TaxID=2916754 RepID=UPI001EE7A034|nr:outer membrane beta-barrel protein [Flaviramulus sp. BrNp1-15]ULC60864.1 porin family protein [Flaviramulus sp. BrNp1-15]